MDDLIERTLRHRADDAVLHEAAADTVRRRAAQVRGRRRAAATSAIAGLTVAAAVVGIAGVGLRLGEHPTVQPAGPRRTVAPSTVDVPPLASIRQASRPEIGYAYGRRLTLADGTSRPFPGGGTASSWLPFADGFLADGPDSDGLVRYDRSGVAVSRYTPVSNPAVSTDGRRAAYVDGKGMVSVARGATDGGTQVTRVTVPGVVGVVGFLPQGLAVDVTGVPRTVRYDGVEQKLPGLRSLNASSEQTGLVVGPLRRMSGDDLVDGVVEPSSGRVLWRTTATVIGFSPDGRYAVGIAQRPRPRVVTLFDARTGAATRTFRVPAGSSVYDVSWEDSAHVLAILVNARTHRQALVRLGVDGSVVRATKVTSSEEAVYVLQQTP